MTDADAKISEIRHPEMARRIQLAIAQHPRIPSEHGRLAYIQREWKTRFDEEISREQVRRWVAGITEPRPDGRSKLAEILGVTVEWLMSGVGGPDEGRPALVENAAAELVMGAMRMNGWDVRPDRRKEIDFVARFRGRSYAVQVKVARPDDQGAAQVKMPADAEGKLILIVIPKGGVAYDLFEVRGAAGSTVRIQLGGDEVQHSGGAEVVRIEHLDRPL